MCPVIRRLRETPGVVVPLAMLVTVVALLLTIGVPNTAAAQLCADGVAVSDPANNPGLVSDCDTLLEARDTLAGSGSLNWSADNPISQWDGITVSGSPLRITKLVLVFGRLSGEIPAVLGDLTHLQTLNLGWNDLSGAIPVELGSLTDLQSLSLSGNQLSGGIPVALGNLPNLLELDLSGNELSGGIPPEMGSLSNLQRLYLSRNELNGGIPAELGNLSNLQTLYLYGTRLSEEIPLEHRNRRAHP